MKRRNLLQAAVASGFCAIPAFRGTWASAAPSRPIVVLDFAHAQSLLAIGMVEFGMAERWRYIRSVEEPELPQQVFDIGTFSEPNLELLAEIKPRTIIHSREWPTDTEQLERIAPLLELSIYTGEPAPLDRARQALVRIAQTAAMEPQASRYLDGFDERMKTYRSRLSPFEGKRVIVLWAATPRDFWTLGSASLVHNVLEYLGLSNAVRETGDIWGWLSVTTRELTELDDMVVIHFGAIPPMLADNPFWTNLAFVREERLIVLPSGWLFGGLPEAERIARILTHAMEGVDHLSLN